MFLLTLIAALDPINGELFNHLYYNYSKKLYIIIINKINNNEDAEDILQDTYRKVYMNIKRFYDLDEESTIKLLTIYAKNTAMDFLRKNRKRFNIVSIEYEADDEEKTLEIADTSALPDNILINKELSERLSEKINELPEKQRHAILLKYKYGMNNNEISKILCISETAVSSRIDRARTSLRKSIKMEADFYE